MKKIILTTMSTLNKASKNFYNADIDGERFYCEGISQLEAGTKYYLSKEKIDEIIVIGSNKVYKDEDDKKCKLVVNKLQGRNLVKEYQEADKNHRPSAFAMYSYGIKCFVENVKQPSPVDYGKNAIDPLRKLEIEKLVQNFDQEIKLDNKDVMEALEKALKTNIEKEYLKDKESYKERDDIKYFAELKSAEEMIRKLDNDSSLNQREKGRILSKAIDFFQKKTAKEISEQKDSAAILVIRKYHDDIKKLIKELEDTKTNRFQIEKEYLREYVYYNLIPDAEKMHCRALNKKVKIRFIPLKTKKIIDDKQGVDNFKVLLSSICKNDESVEIYLDMQGGVRTDGYVRSAVLSLLNNNDKKHVTLKQVIAIDFLPGRAVNKIEDETDRYKITDLVSGMNAFIEYGKANQLSKTWGELHIKNEKIEKIIDLMQGVDHALSLCDVDTLTNNIKELHSKLSEPIRAKSSNEEFIKVLCEDIKEEYKDIVGDDGEVDIVELVRWANNKGFIQQAITLVESKMPGQMVKDGYFSYCENLNRKDEICDSILNIKENKYKFDDADHLLVQQAAHDYYVLLSEKEDSEDKNCNVELHTYHGDQTLLKKYAEIWYRRNNTNHAGDSALVYKDTRDLISDFIELYIDLRHEMKEQGDRLASYSLKYEVKKQKEKEVNKLNFWIVNTVVTKKIIQNKTKVDINYVKKIIRSLGADYPIWNEIKIDDLTDDELSNFGICFKDTKSLVNVIKEKSKSKGRVNISIPILIYKEISKELEGMLSNKKCKIYVMEKRNNKHTCVKVLDKNSF